MDRLKINPFFFHSTAMVKRIWCSFQAHGADECSNYHQGHKANTGNPRHSYEGLVNYVSLAVKRLKNIIFCSTGEEHLVLISAHGTEEGSHSQDLKSTSGNNLHSFESLVCLAVVKLKNDPFFFFSFYNNGDENLVLILGSWYRGRVTLPAGS